ncbi:MAG: DUF1223 domain-containing protein [Caulobacteraceae bacterium]|nr:DUF1223 domain-containing protein [Caulobacteraceae bacterium]
MATTAAARTPVLVELFTSQGCSSCVKSGAVLTDLGDKPPVLTLTFAVDYWDYLGWPDTFAKPEFSDRQRAYMKGLALREVYTPQLVIDGRVQAPANSADKVAPLVKQAARAHRDAPDASFAKGRVLVGSGSPVKGGADVWLVRYDPKDQSVVVKKGDNRGQTIVEHNVVRELTRLGTWSGRSKSYRLPPPAQDGLNTVVILQGAHGGRVLGLWTP